MKDVKRTVLWVLVGFCMISVLISLFNLFAFLQMETTKINQISIDDAESTFFTVSTIAAIICAIVGVALVGLATIQFLKHNKPEKSQSVLVLLIAALVICIIFVVYAFLTPTILKAGNDTFDSFGSDGYFYYGSFTHYQSYLSATLSTFVPLFIAAGLVLGNVICRVKFQNPETAEPENQQ